MAMRTGKTVRFQRRFDISGLVHASFAPDTHYTGAASPMRSQRTFFPLLILLAAAGLLCMPAGFAAKVKPGALELEKSNNVRMVPGDVAESDSVDAEGADGRKKREFVIAPLPSRDPLLGWMLTVPAMWLYKPAFSSAEESTWVSGVVGYVAEDDNWGAGGFHKMSFGDDLWRVSGAYFFCGSAL